MVKKTDRYNELFVIDVETTGPDIFKNDVLYIYMAPLFRKTPELELYIKYPDKDISWGNVGSKYYKTYSDAWSKKAIDYKSAWGEFVEFVDVKLKVESITLTGHNVGFDYSFLKKIAYLNDSTVPSKISHRLFDVHSVLFYYHLKGKIPKSALSSLGSLKYFNLQYSKEMRHTAREDVRVTKEIVLNLLNLNELDFFTSHDL